MEIQLTAELYCMHAHTRAVCIFICGSLTKLPDSRKQAVPLTAYQGHPYGSAFPETHSGSNPSSKIWEYSFLLAKGILELSMFF